MDFDSAKMHHDLEQAKLEIATLKSQMMAMNRILKPNPGLLQIFQNVKMNGVMNFEQFPITPSSAPTADYEVATKKYVDDLIAAIGGNSFTKCDPPLTSTSWDGDPYSTTGKTKIDLSVVFGVPAGVAMVLVGISARDSGSASGQALVSLSPNDTDLSYPGALKLSDITNDRRMPGEALVPCDENGDIYYQLVATGTNTLDVWLEIWGYWS